VKYWEDFTVGEVIELGACAISEADVLAFARKYDPQPFHVDPEAARATIFGGLIASGWHTCAIAMRLMVDKYVGRSASLGSPGLDNIRWLAPVREGDTITYRRRITAARPSESKPGVGLVHSHWEALNQRGETVMTMEGWAMFRRRPEKKPGDVSG